MNKELQFQTYFVLKNEDAPTYIGSNFLVAADGLGGSGSNVHVIDRKKYDLCKDIPKAFWGDLDPQKLEMLDKEYINKLLEPVVDDKDDTSALWASRIIISRLIYALQFDERFANGKLSAPELREKLSEFLTRGLWNTKKYFKLQDGKYSNQIMLPTTLAFIKFEELENSVIAETVWAGDSRCYAITENGLIQLSMDDEDASGAITNLFYVKEGKNAVLNYRKFELPKPCVLMTVSDGVFDPFAPHDNLGVEKTVLNAICSSGSVDELEQNLYKTYSMIRGDDTTIAFLPFGFESYEHLQKVVMPYAETSKKLYDFLYNNQSKLTALDLSESDACDYITTRTGDKINYILGKIAEAYKVGSKDPVVLAVCADVETKAREELEKYRLNEAKKAAALKKNEILEDIISKISDGSDFSEKVFLAQVDKNHPDRANLGEILKQTARLDEKKDRYNDAKPEYTKVVRRAEQYRKLILEKIQECTDKISELYDSAKAFYPTVEQLDAEMFADFNDDHIKDEKDPENPLDFSVLDIDTACSVRSVINKYTTWYVLLLMFDNKEYYTRILNIKVEVPKKKGGSISRVKFDLDAEKAFKQDADLNIIKEIVKFIGDKNKVIAEFHTRRRSYRDQRYTAYACVKNGLLKFLGDSLEYAKFVFTPEYIEQMSITDCLSSCEIPDSLILEHAAKCILAKGSECVPLIVSTLKANYGRETVIDSAYNSSRLRTFREYYLVQNDSKELRSFISDLSAHESKYESYPECILTPDDLLYVEDIKTTVSTEVEASEAECESTDSDKCGESSSFAVTDSNVNGSDDVEG